MVQDENALLTITQLLQRCFVILILRAALAAGRSLMKIEEKQHIIFSASLAFVSSKLFHVLRVKVYLWHAAESCVEGRHIEMDDDR